MRLITLTALLLALLAAPAFGSSVLPATEGTGFGLTFERADRRVSTEGRGFTLEHWRLGLTFAGNMAFAWGSRGNDLLVDWGAGIATGQHDTVILDRHLSYGFMAYLGANFPLTPDGAVVLGFPLQFHREVYGDCVATLSPGVTDVREATTELYDLTVGVQVTWWSSRLTARTWGPLGVVASVGVMVSAFFFNQEFEAYTSADGWMFIDETFSGDHALYGMMSLGLVTNALGREAWVPVLLEMWVGGGGEVFFSGGTAVYF